MMYLMYPGWRLWMLLFCQSVHDYYKKVLGCHVTAGNEVQQVAASNRLGLVKAQNEPDHDDHRER